MELGSVVFVVFVVFVSSSLPPSSSPLPRSVTVDVVSVTWYVVVVVVVFVIVVVDRVVVEAVLVVVVDVDVLKPMRPFLNFVRVQLSELPISTGR